MNTHCLKKYTLAFVSMLIFSLNISASNLFEDVIFHVESNTKNATEPRLTCQDLTPQNFEVQIGLNGRAVVNSTNFGAVSNSNCDYDFSEDGNRLTAEPELQYSQPGIKDAYFHVNVGFANATPLRGCPFEINVLPLRRRIGIKTAKY